MSDQGERKPRVKRLRYIARSDGAIHFRKTHRDQSAPLLFGDDGPPDAVVGSTEEFQVTLVDGRATVEMVADYTAVDDAREVVEPYLRAWEIQAFLQHVADYDDLQVPLLFQFDGADVTNPVPGPGVVIQVPSAAGFFSSTYPSPPSNFVASPDVQVMWLRWREYQAGREPLTTMAYFCLTVVETSAGSRRDASGSYRISGRVLNTLGRLASGVGDEKTARKADVRERRAHTAEEEKWIEEVIPALMQRVGEYAFDSSQQFAELTMADFSPLQVKPISLGETGADNRGQ